MPIYEFECKECSEKLTEMIQGELAEVETEKIQEHVAGCTECNKEAEDLRRTLGVLSTMEISPSPDFVERTTARAAAATAVRKPRAEHHGAKPAASPLISWLGSLYRRPHLAASVALHIMVVIAVYFLVVVPITSEQSGKDTQLTEIDFGGFRLAAKKTWTKLDKGGTVSVADWFEDGKVTLVANKSDRFFSVFSENAWKTAPEAKLTHAVVDYALVRDGKLTIPKSFLEICRIVPKDIAMFCVEGERIASRLDFLPQRSG